MVFHHIRDYIVCIVFLLLGIQSYAQNHSISVLDSITDQLRVEGNINKSIILNKNALKAYTRNSDTEGVINANINLGGLYWYLNDYKVSLQYLETSENLSEKTKSPLLLGKLFGEYGRNYASLGLLNQSNSNLNKAIFYAKKIQQKKQREKLLFYYYTWKIANFEELHLQDSADAVQKDRKTLVVQPLTYVYTAERFLSLKKLDSAEYYLNKALKISDQYSLYQKSMTFYAFGKLYFLKKDYDKALDFFNKSLVIAQKLSRKNDEKNIYKFVSEVYEKLGDISKKSEYLEKYIKIKDSIDDAEREALVIPVKKIIDREKRNERKDRIQLYILITIIIMLALAVIFGLRQRYIRKQKEKEAIIMETLQETDKLKSKLNNSLDELTKLASTNDPFFLMKFKEVYPEFYETLVTRYPHLSPNDIRFSCFLRLNLSTKTIATYKNISIRTIESRKYRLRKKLGLPSDVDLNKWMMEL
ncbi:hypothetical protein [uncultured Chryseobacterium sp.]|uniref:hypothetical protein n=1 Tax=uncultured Chryseobacterium sp. TaxID=259322 RepID=UPI003749CD5C